MTFILSLLPLVIAIAICTAFVKLSAKLFRRTQISWRASLGFVLLGFLVGIVAKGVLYLIGLPTLLAVLTGIAVQIGYGVWFFSRFAKSADGSALNPIAAAKLAGIFLGLVITIFGGIGLVTNVMLQHVPN